MKAIIKVHLKQGVLDPQGKAIAHGLNSIGFDEVLDARQGKIIEVDLKTKADEARVAQMCDKLLANPVIEDYHIELVEDAA